VGRKTPLHCGVVEFNVPGSLQQQAQPSGKPNVSQSCVVHRGWLAIFGISHEGDRAFSSFQMLSAGHLLGAHHHHPLFPPKGVRHSRPSSTFDLEMRGAARRLRVPWTAVFQIHSSRSCQLLSRLSSRSWLGLRRAVAHHRIRGSSDGCKERPNFVTGRMFRSPPAAATHLDPRTPELHGGRGFLSEAVVLDDGIRMYLASEALSLIRAAVWVVPDTLFSHSLRTRVVDGIEMPRS